jgi:Fe2+ transport system protein B
MFIIGFFTGLIFGIILFLVAYAIMREIIFKWGKPLGRMLENQLNEYADKTSGATQIVYPDLTTEMFNKEGSTLEDIIK